ncbi:PucR family transcriptional regulator [Streptomyces sp. NPDC053750]|uniref:PucR family transcriptional regulator n=1 Tax=Streptomyces sp. NPDC053750 TaxID=3365714 RepID=UPI0037D3B07F
MNDAALPGPAARHRRGTPVDTVVRRLADLLGPGLLWCGPVTEVRDLVIAEPGEPLDGPPDDVDSDDVGSGDGISGALVLAVGARGPEAAAMVTAAGAAGAAAVAVRLPVPAAPDTDEHPPADPPEPAGALPRGVRAAAERAGIAVLGIPAGVRWDRVAAEARTVLDHGRGAFGLGPDRSGDLFSLAQTVATLTGGLVSIEDAAHRVVAYAGSGDEADELRRLSVLGRSCPEPYLALLRKLGVHRRLRAGDEVVEVAEHLELGARARLVIGVNSGRRPLGSIWVQEGARPLAERAPEMLRGAARLAAPHLVDHYFQGDARTRLASREELSHGLLTGRFDAAALAAHLGIDPSAGADVLAVDLREPTGENGTGHWAAQRAEAAGIISVHAAAHRKNALVVQACGQIYAILPAPPAGSGADAEGPLLRWTGDLVTTLRRLTGTGVQAVLAGRAERLADIPAVKLRGHRALLLLARTPGVPVGTHTRLTPALLVRDTLDLLAGAPGIRFPAVADLVVRDREQGTDLARSLLLYLDAFGDVGAVAQHLNVHPNTLRYRVRRAVALTGLDLDDPEHRLAAALQLRLDLDGHEREATAFPAP